MKRFAAAAALAALCAGAASAVILPLRIAFQGKLVDPATNQPRNGVFSITFRVYSVPAGGTALHTETQSVSVVNGVFGTHLGTAALLTADLFAGASAYVGVEVAGDGEMVPRQPLSMSAYAFTAMQLASDGGIRINPGVAYSTFTDRGNLQLQYGVAATTLSASAQGNDVYSIFSSSGIRMSSGTLLLGPGSRGVDATGTGVVASTGYFTAGTDGAYGLHVASGVFVASGTALVNGAGGLVSRYGIVASTFSGRGSSMTFVAPDVSQSSDSATVTLMAGTEVVAVSTSLAVGIASQKVLLSGLVQVNRVENAVGTCTARYRANDAGACDTGSAQVYAYTFTVANLDGLSVPAPLDALYAPASIADVSYCLTIVCDAAHAVTTRSLAAMTVAP